MTERFPAGTQVILPWGEICIVDRYSTATDGTELVRVLMIKKNGEPSKLGHWLSPQDIRLATLENMHAIVAEIMRVGNERNKDKSTCPNNK